MDIVSKYTALLGQQKLKESFVRDLELVLSRKYPFSGKYMGALISVMGALISV